MTVRQLLLVFLAFFAISGNILAQGKDPKMDKFINDLMSKMTLEEKIGQLNLPSSGDITTGQAKSSNIAEKIKKGQVGGLFNIKVLKK